MTPEQVSQISNEIAVAAAKAGGSHVNGMLILVDWSDRNDDMSVLIAAHQNPIMAAMSITRLFKESPMLLKIARDEITAKSEQVMQDFAKLVAENGAPTQADKSKLN